MSRLSPLSRAELDQDLMPTIDAGDNIMGFTSNDGMIMARKPALLKAVLGLVQAAYSPGEVDLALKKLIAVMTSSAAGCQYCSAHTQYGALNQDVPAAKLEAIWDFRCNDLFTAAERAALEVARAAALSPNETTDVEFDELKKYFSDNQIVEIVGVISLFGFLNRWNSTMATELEQVPRTLLQDKGLMDKKA